ncbi:MAG TPA: MFS transporter [Paraburkholderia sp.]|nr:MFS transporter [Paraburkholderia sp.]
MFDNLIDGRRIGRRQAILFALCLIVLIIDGMDFQLLAFVSPVLLADWKITKAQLAPALAAALLGMAIGAVTGGLAGDRFGCRRILTLVVGLFGLTTLATALVSGVSQLVVLRFLSGVGFGVAVPTAMALASEWCPRRRRGQLVVMLSIGTMAGGTLGGVIAAWLIPTFGWHSIFLVSGGFTLLCAALSALYLPESLSFLARRGRHDDAQAWVTRVLGRTVNVNPDAAAKPFEDSVPPEAGTRLLSSANLRVNAGLWIAFFAISYASFAYMSWTPAVLVGAGFNLLSAIKCTSIYTLSAAIGVVGCALCLPRFGSRALLVGSLGMTIAATLALPNLLATGIAATGAVSIAMFVVGFGGGMSTSTIYALAAMAYPARYRSTGMGVCIGLSRAGGICSVLSGGIQLEMAGAGGRVFFTVVACFVIAGAIGLAAMDRHISTRHVARRAIV